MANFIHPTADISSEAQIGRNVKIWHQVQIREKVQIGSNCILGKNVYVDFGVKIGKNCKIQNSVSIFQGVKIEDGVFVGPHVCFTNDKYPRAITPGGKLKASEDWQVSPTVVKKGASIGANATILPGITIGKWAMIGSGSVVTKNVPDYGLVIGNPAKLVGKVDKFGKKKS